MGHWIWALEGRARVVRALTGDLLIVLVLALAAAVIAVMPRRIRAVALVDAYRSVFRHELALCALLLAFALDVRLGFLTALPFAGARMLGWVLRAALALLAATVLALCARVVAGGRRRLTAPTDWAIVLGAALENGQPTRDLLSRIDAARACLWENPGATLILTGGNPDADGRTEAAVMAGLLAARGVPEDRMVLEDRAETTRDNFRNTLRMLPPGTPVALITSGYHMDRAARMAKRAGFARVARLPSPSDPRCYGANLLWEVMLDMNDLVHYSPPGVARRLRRN